MVFGNMGDSSATGVAFTRNPATGDNIFYGEWLVNAQGEDVVAGIRTPNPLNDDTKNEQNKHLHSMRGRMSDAKSYVEPYQVGKPVEGGAVAEVVESRSPHFIPGDIVVGMTEAEIEETIAAFGEATRRAIEAGFDGVEIHGANTYLLQQFFSPHANRREDRWGDSIEKRMTFPLAIVEVVTATAAKHAEADILHLARPSGETRGGGSL